MITDGLMTTVTMKNNDNGTKCLLPPRLALSLKNALRALSLAVLIVQ